MNQFDWIGLALGVVIGAAYGLVQHRGLRNARSARPARLFVGAAARLVVLMSALVLAVAVARADLYWLMGSLMLAYGAVFIWSLKQAYSRKS
jgi:hypothetical protein